MRACVIARNSCPQVTQDDGDQRVADIPSSWLAQVASHLRGFRESRARRILASWSHHMRNYMKDNDNAKQWYGDHTYSSKTCLQRIQFELHDKGDKAVTALR